MISYVLIFHEFEIEIIKKRIKNIHLKINLEGKISLSCPKNTPENYLIEFLDSRLDWLRTSYRKMEAKTKYGNKKLINGEEHYLFGKKLIFILAEEKSKKTEIKIENDTNLLMKVHPKTSHKTREKHLQKWYEELLLRETEKFFDKWENELEVTKKELVIKKMKGKWGYCECRRKVICLNTELAKRRLEFVEYVVLHELCHLLVPNHGPEFKKLLNNHMPGWKRIKDLEEI